MRRYRPVGKFGRRVFDFLDERTAHVTGLHFALSALIRFEATCSLSVCGEASNTRRCICGPMTALPKPLLRPHQSLDGTTPDQGYFTTLPLRAAA